VHADPRWRFRISEYTIIRPLTRRRLVCTQYVRFENYKFECCWKLLVFANIAEHEIDRSFDHITYSYDCDEAHRSRSICTFFYFSLHIRSTYAISNICHWMTVLLLLRMPLHIAAIWNSSTVVGAATIRSWIQDEHDFNILIRAYCYHRLEWSLNTHENDFLAQLVHSGQ
jgi:hypothetical protein